MMGNSSRVRKENLSWDCMRRLDIEKEKKAKDHWAAEKAWGWDSVWEFGC
jgi:hypothetical protein